MAAYPSLLVKLKLGRLCALLQSKGPYFVVREINVSAMSATRVPRIVYKVVEDLRNPRFLLQIVSSLAKGQ